MKAFNDTDINLVTVHFLFPVLSFHSSCQGPGGLIKALFSMVVFSRSNLAMSFCLLLLQTATNDNISVYLCILKPLHLGADFVVFGI